MNPKLKAVERDPAEAVCSAVVKAGTGSTIRTTPPSVTM